MQSYASAYDPGKGLGRGLLARRKWSCCRLGEPLPGYSTVLPKQDCAVRSQRGTMARSTREMGWDGSDRHESGGGEDGCAGLRRRAQRSYGAPPTPQHHGARSSPSGLRGRTAARSRALFGSTRGDCTGGLLAALGHALRRQPSLRLSGRAPAWPAALEYARCAPPLRRPFRRSCCQSRRVSCHCCCRRRRAAPRCAVLPIRRLRPVPAPARRTSAQCPQAVQQHVSRYLSLYLYRT
jgi:hypothetical protein